MADTLELVLELADRVSGPAQRAAQALQRIEDRALKAQAATQKAADKVASQQAAHMEKIQRGLMKANQAADKERARSLALADKQMAASAKAREKALAVEMAATRKLGLMQLQAAKMNAAHDKAKKGNTFFGGFGDKLGFRSVADYAKGAFIGDLAAKGVESIVGGFISGAKAAVGLIVDGVKGAFREGGKVENLRLSYKLLLGKQGGAALDDIGRFSKKTKYDDDAIAEMMRPLFNAGLRGKGARSAFAASADLEASGLGPASDFIEKFTKIQLKGGISEKLLIGMGVQIKDFKEALAKETGSRDKEGTFKAAGEGKVDPQAIMNAIFSGIEKRQGGQLGTGAEAAGKTMSARIGKLAILPDQYLKKMSESPAWDKLSDKLGDTLMGLDPDGPRGKKIMDSLFSVFNKIADAVSSALTPENMDKFASGVSRAVDWLGKIPAILDKVLMVSEALAAVWVGKKIVDAIAGGTNAIAAMNPLLIAAAAAIGAIAFAYKQIAGTIEELGGWDKVKQDWKDFGFGSAVKVAQNDAEESMFNDKYGGAGYKLKPAGSNKAPVMVNFNGGVSITAQPGESLEDATQRFTETASKSLTSELEAYSSEGG